jgi:hypothetical protein
MHSIDELLNSNYKIQVQKFITQLLCSFTSQRFFKNKHRWCFENACICSLAIDQVDLE